MAPTADSSSVGEFVTPPTLGSIMLLRYLPKTLSLFMGLSLLREKRQRQGHPRRASMSRQAGDDAQAPVTDHPHPPCRVASSGAAAQYHAGVGLLACAKGHQRLGRVRGAHQAIGRGLGPIRRRREVGGGLLGRRTRGTRPLSRAKFPRFLVNANNERPPLDSNRSEGALRRAATRGRQLRAGALLAQPEELVPATERPLQELTKRRRNLPDFARVRLMVGVEERVWAPWPGGVDEDKVGVLAVH